MDGRYNSQPQLHHGISTRVFSDDDGDGDDDDDHDDDDDDDDDDAGGSVWFFESRKPR